jgi:hypothetical protein
VSVKAVSLAEAVRNVQLTPFLNPEYYLRLGLGPISPILLSARLVTRDDLFANAYWVHRKVADQNILDGDSDVKATARQIKILTDVFNSLGWNGGLRKPSKSLDPGAWWNEWNGPALSTLDLSSRLSELCQTDAKPKAVFTTARQLAGVIPCQKQSIDCRHRYQVNNSSPFRVRCGATGCNDRLRRVGLIH